MKLNKKNLQEDNGPEYEITIDTNGKNLKQSYTESLPQINKAAQALNTTPDNINTVFSNSATNATKGNNDITIDVPKEGINSTVDNFVSQQEGNVRIQGDKQMEGKNFTKKQIEENRLKNIYGASNIFTKKQLNEEVFENPMFQSLKDGSLDMLNAIKQYNNVLKDIATNIRQKSAIPMVNDNNKQKVYSDINEITNILKDLEYKIKIMNNFGF